MNQCSNSDIVTLIKSFELQCNSSITSWASSNQFIILGTISGSLILYEKSNPSKSRILAFPELMETITTITLLNGRTNDIMIGTKKGSLATVTFQFSGEKVVEQSYNIIMKLNEEIIDIILHLNKSLIVCTLKNVILLRYSVTSEGMFKIMEKQKLYETDSEIVQANASETKVLVSTWKSYYIINIFGEECVQVGSKEKQGVHGGTFFQEDTGLTVYVGRPQGRLWKANTLTGKVLNTIQFSSEDGKKLKYSVICSICKSYSSVGRMKNFDKYILSYNDDNLAIFDPFKNEILREERFGSPFLPMFPNVSFAFEENYLNKKSQYFSLLFQEKNTIIIKDCRIRCVKEALDDCFSCDDIDEAIRMFVKYEELWLEKNLERIFERKDHVVDRNLLEDHKLMEIIDKLEERKGQVQIIKRPTLEDFNGLDLKETPISLTLVPSDLTISTMKIKSQPQLMGYQKLSAACLGLEFIQEQGAKIKRANQQLKRLFQNMLEKKELVSLLEMNNTNKKKRSSTKSNKRSIIECLLKLESRIFLNKLFYGRICVYNKLPRCVVAYHVESYYREECSLVKMEQISSGLKKKIKEGSIRERLNGLILKRKLYGFLNKYERDLIKYYIAALEN